jgi:hypothetical protein
MSASPKVPRAGSSTRAEDTAPAGRARRLTMAVRTLLVAAGLVLWFQTQKLISRRELPTDAVIGDRVHDWTASWHAYLVEHPAVADGLLIVSSLAIDLLAGFILLRAILGPSVRPFVGLFLVFLLRQVSQGLNALPAPPGMIWRDPGFPTLLVTYHVGNDFFFSGHTALAVFGAVELARLARSRWLLVAAVLLALFEAAVVLVLRAHWTMDVVAGAMVALWGAAASAWLAPPVDAALARWANRGRAGSG